jgi:type II secretory pathway pseudopilin PulG
MTVSTRLLNEVSARRANAFGLRGRSAFTFAEVLVSIAIAAVLGAMIIPAVLGRITDASIRRQATTLSTLAQAITTYHDHVGMWPSSLAQLSTAPVAGALNICGDAMAAKDVARWLGPYISFPIGGDLTIEGDIIRNTLVRDPAASSSIGVIQIKLEYPSSDERTSIQNMLDVDTDNTIGSIRWSGSDPTVTLTYNIPVIGC